MEDRARALLDAARDARARARALIFADAVALIHLAFVLLVWLGWALVVRWPKLAWIHLPCLAWGMVIAFTDVICPLTPLEKRLRVWGGGEAYEGGFIRHYLVGPVLPGDLPRWVSVALVVAWLLLNGWAYWRVIRRRLPVHAPRSA